MAVLWVAAAVPTGFLVPAVVAVVGNGEGLVLERGLIYNFYV